MRTVKTKRLLVCQVQQIPVALFIYMYIVSINILYADTGMLYIKDDMSIRPNEPSHFRHLKMALSMCYVFLKLHAYTNISRFYLIKMNLLSFEYRHI